MGQLKSLLMSHRCYICYDNDLPDELNFHPKCSKRVFGSEEPPEMPYGLDEMKDLAIKIIQSQSVVTGVQPKISMGIEKAKKERGRLVLMEGTFILKPPSEKYEQLPENEDLTMRLAELAGIETVPHALIPLKTGELAYITKRIDRSEKDKIHMEDFCQLSGLLTENKYRSSMEKVGKVISAYSDNAGLDLFNLFVLTVFCYSFGNNDMHLKNFSLIRKDQSWGLAPAYDLLNTALALPDDIEESALTIAGRKRKITKENFISLGKSFGLTEKQIKNAFSQVVEPSYLSLIESSFLSDKLKEDYFEIYDLRTNNLEN